jgi:hypothetical protein
MQLMYYISKAKGDGIDISIILYLYFAIAISLFAGGVFLMVKNIRPIIGFFLVLATLIMIVGIFMYHESPLYVYRVSRYSIW